MSLEVKNINLYLNKHHILNDVSLDIKTGEFVSVLGKSGCGKTSLIKSIAGFYEISTGDILIKGESILGLAPEKRQTVIVFQDLRLFPNMNVEENIAFSMKLRKFPRQKIKERVEELLDLVQLPGFEKRKIAGLSGGQLQRVALARAIGADPKLLLLDEPFSGLDESLRKDMGKLVRDLHRKNNITTLMITHDKEEALKLSDKIALMRDGQILQYDTPISLFHNPSSKEVAEFMGEVNYFAGNIIQKQFVCEFGKFDIKDDMSSAELMLRPSQIQVYPSEDGAYHIKEIIYQGEYVSLVLSRDRDYQVSLSYEEFRALDIETYHRFALAMKDNISNIVLL